MAWKLIVFGLGKLVWVGLQKTVWIWSWLWLLIFKPVRKRIKQFFKVVIGDLWLSFGKLFLRTKLLTLSIQVFRTAYALEPEIRVSLLLAETYLERACRRFEKRQVEGALADLSRCIDEILIPPKPDAPLSQDELALLVECLEYKLKVFLDTERLSEAAAVCDELIKLKPQNIKMDELYVERAYCELQGGNLDKAIDTLRETPALYKTDLVRKRLYDYLLIRFKRQYDSEFWGRLIPDIEEMIPIAPDEQAKLDLLRGLSEAQALTGDLAGACEVLRKGLQEFPASAELKTDLFATLDSYRLLCGQRNEWRTVVEVCNEQLRFCDPQDNHALGVLYLSRANGRRVCGEYEDAIGDSTKSLQYEQGNGDALTCRGLAELGVGLLDEAIGDLTAAIDNATTVDKDLALRGRAEVYQRKDLHESAIKDYLTLTQDLQSSQTSDYLGLVRSYKALKRHSEIVTLLTVALLKSRDPQLFTGRGDAYRLMGDHDHAIADFIEAIRISPSGTAYDAWGLSLVAKAERPGLPGPERQALLVEAAAFHRKAAEKLPDVVGVWYHLAAALTRLGDREGASKALEHARSLQEQTASQPGMGLPYVLGDVLLITASAAAPDISDELQQLADRTPDDAFNQFYAGWAKIRAGETNEAISYFTEAVRLDPQLGEAYAWRGLAQSRLENWPGAIADADTARKLKPELPLAWVVAGVGHFRLGDRTDPVPLLEEAIRLSPAYADAHRNLLAIRDKRQEWEKAISEGARAIQAGIRDPSIYVAMANAFRMTGKVDKCMEDCNEALLIDPAFWTAHYVRGLTLAVQKLYDTALGDLEMPLRPQFHLTTLDKATIYWARGAVRRLKGDLDSAIESLTEAMSINPGFKQTYYDRGWAHLQKGDLAAALADFERLVQLDEKSWDAYCGRGEVRRLEAKLEEALADVNRAIALKPDLYFAYGIRGRIYINKTDWESAVRDLSKAIEEPGPHPDLYYLRGECRRNNHEWDAAIADYSKAIEEGGKLTASAYSLRGWCRAEINDSEKALEDLNRAVELEPISPQLLANLGWTCHKLGRWSEALEVSDRALGLDPKSVTHLHLRSNTLSQMERWEDAIESYTKLVEVSPKPGLGGRGWVKRFAGDYAGAVADLSKAVELDAKDKYIMENLGWAKNGLGDWQGAIAASTAALELDPSFHFSHQNRALAKCQLGDLDSATQDLFEELENCLDGFTLLAPKRTPSDQRAWKAVCRDWEAMIQEKPLPPVPWLGLALARWMAGQIDASLQALDRAIELDTSFLVPHLLRALASMEAGKITNATADVTMLLSEAPPDWSYRPFVLKVSEQVRLRQTKEELPRKLIEVLALESPAPAPLGLSTCA